MPYARFYEIVSRPWRQLPYGPRLLTGIDKLLVALIAAAYGVTLVWLVSHADARWLRVAAVPAAVLIIVTIARKVIDAPRPYEAYDIDVLVPGSTKGQSMPSRHVASAVIIACTLGYIDLRWGLAAGVASVLVAYARVAGGRHFPRDVVAGALLSLVCALIGFVVL